MIISDSSVIILLAKLNKLEILKRIYGKVNVPEIVYKEITIKASEEIENIKNASSYLIETKLTDDEKQKAFDLRTNEFPKSDKPEKHMGECQAIVLAERINLKNSIDTTINTTSGDITVGNTDKLEITTTSGDIKTGSVKESIYAKATSGDFLLGDINGKLTLNTTSGDIKINKVNLTNDSTVKVTSGDVVIGETNDIYIDAHAVSGDVKVNTNNRKSDYELKINTTSGDIIVNN